MNYSKIWRQFGFWRQTTKFPILTSNRRTRWTRRAGRDLPWCPRCGSCRTWNVLIFEGYTVRWCHLNLTSSDFTHFSKISSTSFWRMSLGRLPQNTLALGAILQRLANLRIPTLVTFWIRHQMVPLLGRFGELPRKSRETNRRRDSKVYKWIETSSNSLKKGKARKCDNFAKNKSIFSCRKCKNLAAVHIKWKISNWPNWVKLSKISKLEVSKSGANKVTIDKPRRLGLSRVLKATPIFARCAKSPRACFYAPLQMVSIFGRNLTNSI